MPEYTGPEEVSATNASTYAVPPGKQMGGLEPFETNDPLVTLFYRLLRDHVTPGHVEQVVCEIERTGERQVLLTNAYLGEYATNLTERMVRVAMTRAKIMRSELEEQEPVPDRPPTTHRPLSPEAVADNATSRDHQRRDARAAAEGRLRGWMNCPMSIPLPRVIEQAFRAVAVPVEQQEGDLLFDHNELLETVAILTEQWLPDGE